MKRLRKTSPAAPMAAALIATALGYDTWLVRNQYETISSFVRRSGWRKAIAVYLACHLCLRWRYDPLSLVGQRFVRTPTPSPKA